MGNWLFKRAPVPAFPSKCPEEGQKRQDVVHCLLILILQEREKRPSFWTHCFFSYFSIGANGACPQSSNMQFGANNGNYLRQDTTVIERLKFLLSETWTV